MPYINIRLGTALEGGQREQLFEKTTTLMNTVMGKKREVTVVHIQESDPQQWATNAIELAAEDPIQAYVDIKVTAGTNTPEQKVEMLSKTVKMLKEVIGAIQEACYVVIDDVPSDSWGYNGKTQAERATLKL
ncbi:MAG: tautomerase family protein [Sedimenticola sp.]